MIAQTIQLALAPVFPLVAIGNIISSLSQRLGRVVDRSREMQGLYDRTSDAEHDRVVREMRLIARRIRLIGAALRLLVIAGVVVGLTVAILFMQEVVRVDLQLLAAGTFLVAVTLLMAALLLFLRETQVATQALEIPKDYLELDRSL